VAGGRRAVVGRDRAVVERVVVERERAVVERAVERERAVAERAVERDRVEAEPAGARVAAREVDGARRELAVFRVEEVDGARPLVRPDPLPADAARLEGRTVVVTGGWP